MIGTIALAALSLGTGLGSGQGAFDLRPRLIGSRPLVFNVAESRTEGGKRTDMGTRYAIAGGGSGFPMPVELTTGPYTVGKRTFGRPKTARFDLDVRAVQARDGLKRPPFPLSVALPGRRTKVGDSWVGVVYGPTPMPAGTKGTYRVLGVTSAGGAKCAKIGLKVALPGVTAINGSGEFLVRLDDGFVQSGSARFEIAYTRPDPVTKKVSVSGRVQTSARVSRGR